MTPLKFYTFYGLKVDYFLLLSKFFIVLTIVSCDLRICLFVNKVILLRLLYMISFDKNGPLFFPKIKTNLPKLSS